MQSSDAVGQQSLPVFRQPTGVHIPHYPANYLPYGQYFLPFYPPTIHPFLSNAAFPQQPPTGSIFPGPGAAAGPSPVKYAMSQYKPATNVGNPSHVGMPIGYETYSPSAVTTGNSTGNEDHATSQYKENNVYITGRQFPFLSKSSCLQKLVITTIDEAHDDLNISISLVEQKPSRYVQNFVMA